MLHPKLINPSSIVVVGASENQDHIGGSVLKNLIDQQYAGKLYAVNPNKDQVQDIRSFRDVTLLPEVDLAIIAIPATSILKAVQVLLSTKKTKAFIIYAAGFAELSKEGEQLQNKIAAAINEAGGSLLGPNNIGMINHNYAGIFTKPIPKIDPKGVDFISGSGATAVFSLEIAREIGLSFSSVITVGNSAQVGVEEILEYLDDSFVIGKSSKTKLLYLETVKNPEKLLKHSLSLRKKGCSILALKSGITEKGKAAAASHTGALVNTEIFIQALFKKAGIIRCKSRYELITTAAILQESGKIPKKYAIITHAGGPAVILTDTLESNGLKVPDISKQQQLELKQLLFDGASTKNPIDILATGTAEQLADILDYCDNEISEIDAVIVIFGSPGLGSVNEAFQVIDQKKQILKKPIFTVLPSIVNTRQDIQNFIKNGNIAFPDEYLFGNCLGSLMNSNHRIDQNYFKPDAELKNSIQQLIQTYPNGFLNPEQVYQLLTTAKIKMAKQALVNSESELMNIARKLTYPVVQKVVGPLHKSDNKGVITSVPNITELTYNYRKLIRQKGVNAVMIQQMVTGKEVFIGSKREKGFPPLVLCGSGGVYIEAYNDFSHGLAPINKKEAKEMVHRTRIKPILQGIRGESPCDLDSFYKTIEHVSNLLLVAPEIVELDINPLMISEHGIIAVDARIKLKKK